MARVQKIGCNEKYGDNLVFDVYGYRESNGLLELLIHNQRQEGWMWVEARKYHPHK